MPFSREELACLGREYLLAGHLIDRAGMPLLLGEHGRKAMEEVAIEEWMAASPLYTGRMQRLLGFEGDDVATIFKGMQLDIGAPPEFMDFRYRVHNERRGEFWLEHCGALMDVEPMGEDLVVAMCHHIEDPTFDATAQATNPRARVRPIHRPPRHPADRQPHCHWTVEIDNEGEQPAPVGGDSALASSQAARLPNDRSGGAHVAKNRTSAPPEASIGRTDYAGAFDPELRLESFSQQTLVAILDEVCLQGHLLSLAFARAVERRFGAEVAASLSRRQFTGIAGLAARRLNAIDNDLLWWRSRRENTNVSATRGIAEVLELHPAFRPRSYVDLRVRVTPSAGEEPEEVVVEINDCPALAEEQPSWIGLLAAGHAEPLEAIVQAVEPRAIVESLRGEGTTPGARWRVRLDPTAAPARPKDEVELAAFSTGADFTFVGDPHRRRAASHDSTPAVLRNTTDRSKGATR